MTHPPPLELDPRWFTILAQNGNVAISKHISGGMDIWQLEWKHKATYGNDADAWEKYMHYVAGG